MGGGGFLGRILGGGGGGVGMGGYEGNSGSDEGGLPSHGQPKNPSMYQKV